MKAMILAAGRGERMRPLTDTLPKPLVAVRGQPLIERHLLRLAAAGFRDIVINVAHLGGQIVARVGNGERFGVRIAYSREPEPLETAGGLALARELLGPAPHLLVNGDIYCDYDFGRLRGHALEGRLAHLVLVPNPAHNPDGDFSLRGSVLGIHAGISAATSAGTSAAPRHTYSGIAVISPALTRHVAAGGKAPLGRLLVEAAGRGELSGELYGGRWSDVGTVERLQALEAELAASPL